MPDMATINLTDEERSEIVNALYNQAERFNATYNDKKVDASVRAICKVNADRTVALASRLKHAKSFQYTAL